MKPDFEQYLQCFEGLDLTLHQKMELLQELWKVIEMFVDLGFGVEATQYVLQMNQMNPSKQAEDSVGFNHNQNLETKKPKNKERSLDL